MRRRQENQPFSPFVLQKSYSFGPPEVGVAAMEVGDSYFCLEYRIGESQVVLYTVKKDDFRGRHTRLDAPVAPEVNRLKSKALLHGATLEAIQLLSQLTALSKQEEAIMAENKLSRKPAGPDKEGLKAGAKAAPVGGKKAPAAEKEAPKRKGNPEALAKARAARDSGPDKRKITVLKKDHGARAGTARATLLNLIFKQKTVEAAVEAGVKKSDVSWAAREGYISLA